MNDETLSGLLSDIKLYLGVTWTDPDTDGNLSALIEDGVAYLDGKLGTAGDYTVPGFPRQLLKEYVRYARDAALDVFENNYRSLLMGMQTERQVAAFVEVSGETGL